MAAEPKDDLPGNDKLDQLESHKEDSTDQYITTNHGVRISMITIH